jgi:Mg-chelatase subunit ChlI
MCYAAKTWHGDFLGMVIFGASEMSRNVDFGDETTTMVCKFVLRASSASILNEITSDLQQWLNDLTDGAVAYITEEEVQQAAAEKLKRSMEQMEVFKAAAASRPPPTPPPPPQEEEEEEEEEEKEKEKDDAKASTEGNGADKQEKRKVAKGPKEPSTLSTFSAEEIEHRALQAAILQEWEIFRLKQSSTKF